MKQRTCSEESNHLLKINNIVQCCTYRSLSKKCVNTLNLYVIFEKKVKEGRNKMQKFLPTRDETMNYIQKKEIHKKMFESFNDMQVCWYYLYTPDFSWLKTTFLCICVCLLSMELVLKTSRCSFFLSYRSALQKWKKK